jgi:hypothetical protein
VELTINPRPYLSCIWVGEALEVVAQLEVVASLLCDVPALGCEWLWLLLKHVLRCAVVLVEPCAGAFHGAHSPAPPQLRLLPTRLISHAPQEHSQLVHLLLLLPTLTITARHFAHCVRTHTSRSHLLNAGLLSQFLVFQMCMITVQNSRYQKHLSGYRF